MKRVLAALALVSLIIAGIIAFRPPPKDKPTTIRIGVATAGAGTPPVFGGSSSATAQIKGWIEEEFKADGVTVEWKFFKGAGPAVNEALANNQLDFAFQGDFPAILGKASGLKTKLIMASGIRADVHIAVPPESTIASVKDLVGKRVAMFKGTNLQLAVDRLLEANGLSERDLKIINLDFTASQAALAAKDIDAAFGGFELFLLRDKGIAKIIYSSKGDDPGYTRHAHFLVTEDFERNYPDIVGRVVNTLVKSARWTSDEQNREEVFTLWAKTAIPASIWREVHAGEPMKLRHSPRFDEFLIHRYKQAVADSLRYKLIRSDIDVDRWIDATYVDAAVKAQNLEGYWESYDIKGKPLGATTSAHNGR